MLVKRFLQLTLLALVASGLLLAAGCGGKDEAKDQTTGTTTTQEEGLNGLTKSNPLKVDKQAGTISFLAQVNGKYFSQPTRHGAVFYDGANGEKAILRAFAEPEPFYNGLLELGAKAGNNMTAANKETTHVSGDALDVTVTWNGANQEYKLDEVVKESNGKPVDIRFGGNLKAAQDKKTGCLICLDSCPVGITSNANYTYGAVEKRDEVGFTGNKDLLPADGGLVIVTLKLK
ncbi:MAG TPA: YdjY domain-containing protein [Bacillota bacterium]|nr:YdjY domain-containing protein [Bacillota bacterium]